MKITKFIIEALLRIFVPIIIIVATIIAVPIMIMSGILLAILFTFGKNYSKTVAGGERYIYPTLTSDL